MPWDPAGGTLYKVLFLAGAVSIGGLSFFLFAHLFRCDEMIFLVKNVKRKLRK